MRADLAPLATRLQPHHNPALGSLRVLRPSLLAHRIRPCSWSTSGARGAGGRVLLHPLPGSDGSQLHSGLCPQHRAATLHPLAAPSWGGETGHDTRLQLSCTHKTLGEGPEGAWEGPAPPPCKGSGQDLVLQAGHSQV